MVSLSQLPKGEVDLNRVELSGVVLQEFVGGSLAG